jgi:hypothetical protein
MICDLTVTFMGLVRCGSPLDSGDPRSQTPPHKKKAPVIDPLLPLLRCPKPCRSTYIPFQNRPMFVNSTTTVSSLYSSLAGIGTASPQPKGRVSAVQDSTGRPVRDGCSLFSPNLPEYTSMSWQVNGSDQVPLPHACMHLHCTHGNATSNQVQSKPGLPTKPLLSSCMPAPCYWPTVCRRRDLPPLPPRSIQLRPCLGYPH